MITRAVKGPIQQAFKVGYHTLFIISNKLEESRHDN